MSSLICIGSVVALIAVVASAKRRSDKAKEANKVFGDLCGLHNDALRAGVDKVDIASIMANAAILKNQGDVAELKRLRYNFAEIVAQVTGQ
ncbi:hypothetical protein [Vibrio phage vB_ValS_PJ32]|nr:hypothetical protein [Vibrio phage vB_ValS_PJ32]